MDKSIVPVNQIAARSSTDYKFSNPNRAEVVEIEDDPVEVVDKQMEELKLNHQFNEKDVPQIFQDLMKGKMNRSKDIAFYVYDQYCTIILDEMKLTWEKKGKDWLISYESIKNAIKTDDPEKSIIDHLWFVLKNPNIKLSIFQIRACKTPQFEVVCQNQLVPKIDFEKVNTLLQSMFNTFDHQIHVKAFCCEAFSISMFLSMLKHLKPRALVGIEFNISWKNEQNYEKMKETIATDQWKQAKSINSAKVIPPLKIEDLLHCKDFMLKFEVITPEDVIRARELFINSTNSQSCYLCFGNEPLDINAFRKVLLPNSLSERTVNMLLFEYIVFTYKLPNSPNCLEMLLSHINIVFEKKPN
ncbi:unnamed protein product [Caenorhabditis brenneri]